MDFIYYFIFFGTFVFHISFFFKDNILSTGKLYVQKGEQFKSGI